MKNYGNLVFLTQADLQELADLLYGLQTTDADSYFERAEAMRGRILNYVEKD